ncbi:MAG: gliding motility-associated C-terminal domain-containing protein [Flavobacteriales bacterium]|nr:gliding motility-associated C-terminal domain-containing protein [Flavobacteriales bacterium]
MKRNTINKLKAYSLVAGALVSTTDLLAEVITTDLEPDVVINVGDDYFPLDLDNDGWNDAWIEVGILNGVSSFVYATAIGGIAGVLYTGYPVGYALNASANVVAPFYYSVTLAWEYPDPSSNWGYWEGVENKYLGVQFYIEDEVHYGWIELSVAEGCGQATIHAYGYEDEAEEEIQTPLDARLWAPNVFNPNNPDPQNQAFYVRGFDLKEIKIMVFDKWGNTVFETDDINEGWDGTFKGETMSTGVYVYHVMATSNSDEELEIKGNVTLIR